MILFGHARTSTESLKLCGNLLLEQVSPSEQPLCRCSGLGCFHPLATLNLYGSLVMIAYRHEQIRFIVAD